MLCALVKKSFILISLTLIATAFFACLDLAADLEKAPLTTGNDTNADPDTQLPRGTDEEEESDETTLNTAGVDIQAVQTDFAADQIQAQLFRTPSYNVIVNFKGSSFETTSFNVQVNSVGFKDVLLGLEE